MEWKKKTCPPYNEIEVGKTIRNLAVLKWLDIEPSSNLSTDIETELMAV